MTTYYDAIVIGGGQSGLAAGYYLQKEGAKFLILEAAAQATGSWQHHYDSLSLFSPAKYSSLPDFPFTGDQERYPKKEEVVAYLKAFQTQFNLPVLTNSPVSSVEKIEDDFKVITNETTYLTKSVVSATGGFRNPYLPSIEGEDLFKGQRLHSFAYKNETPFENKRVIVVGAGNSAIQIAAELANVAEVTLATREPIQFQKQRILGKDLHFWLKWTAVDIFPTKEAPQRNLVIDSDGFQDALREGKFNERQMFTTFYEDGVVWANGEREAVDAVIFATGFRPNVDYLADLGVLAENGRIQHKKGISTTTPGLYFVGIPFQRNIASATIRGAGPDAKFVVKHLREMIPFTGRKPAKKHTRFEVICEKYCDIFCAPTNAASG